MSKSDFAIAFFNQLFEKKKYLHQYLVSKVNFSLGDVFYILLALFLIYFISGILSSKNRKKGILSLLVTLNILYFIYQLFWGMLYFQKPLINDLPKADITINEAKKISLKYLQLCIDDRKRVDQDKSGVFTIHDLKEIELSVLKDQLNLPKKIIRKNTTEIDAFKPSLFKGIMSFTGILGYYNPFTSEAQYNAELPATYIPFTLAHESSHQLGFAREQEANFVGFLIGRHSKNEAVKYSTDLFVLKSLLSYINENDPVFVQKILLQYSAGMKRDRLNDKLFMQKHQSFLNVVFAFTNNLFLKSNQQEGSITYSYFTELLIKFERLNT